MRELHPDGVKEKRLAGLQRFNRRRSEQREAVHVDQKVDRREQRRDAYAPERPEAADAAAPCAPRSRPQRQRHGVSIERQQAERPRSSA